MIQIDVKDIVGMGMVKCSMYTGERCVNIFMEKYEYENLMRDGFFIRDGKERDSAGVLNTTEVYELQKQDREKR